MRTVRIVSSQVGQNAPAKTQRAVYSTNLNRAKPPKTQRQQPIWQLKSASTAAVKFTFFNTSPANIPIDGDGYRTPFIKKDMEIIGIGLDIHPKELTGLTRANVKTVNYFNYGATELFVGKTSVITFQNSEIGPHFRIDDEVTSGEYLLSFEKRPVMSFRELRTGVVDSMTVTNDQDVYVDVNFNTAWGLASSANNEALALICTLLTVPLEEQFIG